jgi:hypothetical protein
LQRAESAKTRQEDEFKDSVDSKCFPADTVVFTTSGTKPIADVQVGDYLSTTCGFSSVYLLAHANDNIVSTFVEITTDSQHILQLSPAHYIKVNGHHSCAKNVKIGDSLTVRINGMNHTSLTYQEARVTEVREVEKTGLYSPFTMCGDIEVVSNEMNSGVIGRGSLDKSGHLSHAFDATEARARQVSRMDLEFCIVFSRFREISAPGRCLQIDCCRHSHDPLHPVAFPHEIYLGSRKEELTGQGQAGTQCTVDSRAWGCTSRSSITKHNGGGGKRRVC